MENSIKYSAQKVSLECKEEKNNNLISCYSTVPILGWSNTHGVTCSYYNNFSKLKRVNNIIENFC